MPTYEMRAPNGRSYRIQGPAGATDEQVRAEILRQHPDASKAAAPKPKSDQPGRAASFTKGGLAGAANVLLAPIELLVSGMEKAGLSTGNKNAMSRDKAAAQQQLAKYEQANPGFYTAGKITGEALASAPFITAGGTGLTKLGGAVAKAAPRVGAVVQRVGRAVQTGGIGSGRTAAQSAAMTRGARIGQLAERVAGGAIAGAGGAGLAGQDMTEGAAFGAGLPVMGSILKRVAGFAGDITKLPRQKAAEIIRKSLGDNLDAARAAFAQLSPDDKRLAEQVLIDAKIEPDTFFGVGQIAERELQPPGVNPMRETLEAQTQSRAARLAQAAGGDTSTAQRAGIEQASREVQAATAPLREQALDTVQQTNKAMLDAERIADLARARADELASSGQVSRMRGLETRSREQLDAVFQNPGFFTESRPVVRAGEIADSAGQRADAGISTQVGLRDLGREMEDIVAELAAQGRDPLLAEPLSRALRQQANAPGVRVSSARRALLKLANQIDSVADRNGMLNPHDLYTLRKEASDIVEKYVASSAQPSTGSKKRAASLVMGFKQAVDEAMGPEFREYLAQHRMGMQAVNNRELAVTGAQLADENPGEFIKLMRGNRDKIVEDVMGRGTGQYDIAGMALSDPRRYLAMKTSADELAALNRMTDLRSSGAGSAANLMMKERPSLMARGLAAATLSPFPAVRIGATGAEQVERAVMAPRVQRQIAEAYTSGQSMGDLVNTFPMSGRISEQVSTLSPMARNVLAQLLRGYTTNQ